MNESLNLIIDDSLNQTNQLKKIYIHPFSKKLNDEKNYEILEYHWNDYVKLTNDYKYVDKFCSKLIVDLAKTLNVFHKKEYSQKFWEILIGNWIHNFSFMIFDRWEILNKLDNSNTNYNIVFKDYSDHEMISQTLDEFNNLYFLNDYNSYLFYKIIKHRYENEKKFLITFKNIKPSEFLFVKNKFEKTGKNLKSKIFYLYKFIFAKKLKNQKYAIIRSYLGIKDEIKINFKLFQLPCFIPNNYFNCNPNLELRKKIILENKSENDFENFIYKNIFSFIPVSYLEGFKIEDQKVQNLNLPKKPKKIFSCNIINKSLLKRYCANQVENKSKLILGTHGGSYGHYDIHFSEKFECKIADTYLTWGWNNRDNMKIKPFGIIRPLIKLKKKRKSKLLTMIVPAQTIFSRSFESHISLIHNKDFHFNPFFKIIDHLDDKIKLNDLLLRFYPRNLGLNEFEVFQERYPEIKKDKQNIDYKSLISDTKIFLSPYLGTGYLETLALNIPTIVFNSKKNNYLIREEAKKFYDNLKKAKVFFDDEIDLSNHINDIWNSHNDWWSSKIVQNEVKIFVNEFALHNDNKLKRLKELLVN